MREIKPVSDNVQAICNRFPWPGNERKIILQGIKNGQIGLIRLHFVRYGNHSPGFVGAPGILPTDLPVQCFRMCKAVTPECRCRIISTVRPGPASATGCFEGTPPAFSREEVRVAEGSEEFGILPDFRKWRSADISGAYGEIGARGHIAIGKNPAIVYTGDNSPVPMQGS